MVVADGGDRLLENAELPRAAGLRAPDIPCLEFGRDRHRRSDAQPPLHTRAPPASHTYSNPTQHGQLSRDAARGYRNPPPAGSDPPGTIGNRPRRPPAGPSPAHQYTQKKHESTHLQNPTPLG